MAETVVFIRNRPFFGAQILTFPFLYLLKRFSPEDRIRVISRHSLGHLYNSLPWVDEFVVARGLKQEWRAVGNSCKRMISLQPSSERHPFIAFMRRPPIRIGFSNRRVWDAAWTHSVRFDDSGYRALYYLNLLASSYEFDSPAILKECFEQLAKDHPERNDTASFKVTLMPGGGAGEFKKWGCHNYLELCDKLKNITPEVSFTFVLGPDEIQEKKAIQHKGLDRVRILDSPSLSQLSSAVLESHLVVANDCGPSHVAQCAGVPFIGIFDTEKPEWYWPRRFSHCLVPEEGEKDIKKIPVSRVLEACVPFLSDNPKSLLVEKE